MFNPNYGLFEVSGNGRSSQISAVMIGDSQVRYKEFYRFTGRMIARAIIEGVTIDAHMTRSLLKHLLGLPMRLNDLEAFDEELYGSLEYVLHNDPGELGLRFVVNQESCGLVTTIDLIENGRNIEVTSENRQEYVNLMVDHYLTARVKEQLSNFCQGFYELIPMEELLWFTPDELDLLICGLPEIDVVDLLQNCRFIFPYNAGHPTVQIFFNVLARMTAEEKAKFLIFLTGSSQVPVGGFAALAEMGRPVRIAAGGDPRRGELPRAHTCWNQLDLPAYDNAGVMKEKLLQAIHYTEGFGFA
jgi:hypothetical protein